MIRYRFGFSKPETVTFPEFVTWLRKVYKNIISGSGYVLDIDIYLGEKPVMLSEEIDNGV